MTGTGAYTNLVNSRRFALGSRRFAAAVVLGTAVRLAALPLPGTNDVSVFKIWSFAAARESPGRLYGVGGNPPIRRTISLHGAETTVDYPPLALAELGVAGRIYRSLNHGRYPDNTWLVVAVKTPALVADAGVLILLYFGLRRLAGEVPARWAAVVYWLNPAVVLEAPILGYLDPLFLLPAMASLAAADRPAIAGALGAVALLTKPQAVLVAPALALAVVTSGTRADRVRRAARAASAASIVLAAGVAPIVIAGAWPNFLNAMDRLRHHDMLSANACNLWWIVGYALRAYYSMHDLGVWAAFTAPARILGIGRVMELGYANPREIGTALTLAAFGWAIWTARRTGDLWAASALAALLVHAYSTLSAQVHENHLFAAVPFLILAAAGRPAFTPILVALTAIYALNLNVFYGISEGMGYAIPRAVTVIDLTVVLSLLNCGVLGWHMAVFSRECSRAGARRPEPAPA